MQPELTQLDANTVIASTPWSAHVVITLAEGKIADMQGCRSRRDAERFARRSTRR